MPLFMSAESKSKSNPGPDVEELQARLKELERESRLHKRFGPNIKPDQFDELERALTKEQDYKEKLANSGKRIEEENQRKRSENLKIAQELLDSGTLRVTVNGTRVSSLVPGTFHLPCPACGKEFSPGDLWFYIDKCRELQGNKAALVQHFSRIGNNPFDPTAGRSFEYMTHGCTCGQHIEVLIQYLLVD